jgi:nitrate reductase gamma subunit
MPIEAKRLRQMASLHHALSRWVHYAASLAAAHAGMKFAIAHNIPTFRLIKLMGGPIRYFYTVVVIYQKRAVN